MSLLELVVAYLLVSAAVCLFIWCLCMVAGRADDQANELLHRERLARAAKDQIDKDRGGFRAR